LKTNVTRPAWILVAAPLLLSSCGDLPESAGGDTGAASCSVSQANTIVADTMKDWYFWYTELPNVDPARYASPEAYLEAVRYRPVDESFSYIAGKAADSAFFSDSQFIGFGFGTLFVGRDLYVSQVFPDSPASEARLARGERFVSIGGRSIEDLLTSGTFGAAFGADEVGVRIEFVIRGRDGADRSIAMFKRLVTIPTVSDTQVYEVRGRKVGYIFFRNFVTPSGPALTAAFSQLSQAGATDLVLDLRYNGGGLISVAQQLASLIGGTRTTGQPFVQYVHNDKHTSRNTTTPFQDLPGSLNLSSLVAITTRSSASASELIINALRPFIPVTIVGDRTYGKPVGQYSFDFCDKVLHPVAFATVNARGEGNYFGGFPPDCAAGDDVTHLIGDPQEASLAEALRFTTTGACSASAAGARATAVGDTTRAPRRDPFHELIGAY
jgi:carboxyl-terminal processing protease